MLLSGRSLPWCVLGSKFHPLRVEKYNQFKVLLSYVCGWATVCVFICLGLMSILGVVSPESFQI